MGTSVSQRSPETLPWDYAQNAYTDPDMPLEDALRFIWRASDSNENEQLSRLLAEPAVALLAGVAATASTPQEASREATRLIVSERAASLATDLARRAAIQSVGKPDAFSAYVTTLFSEATNYLVSRDINGYVQPTGKLRTIGDAVDFKYKLAEVASQTASRVAPPTAVDPSSWGPFVKSVVTLLKRRTSRR